MKTTKIYDDAINNAVFVSGIPRSGTTVFAGLLATCRGVEYSYETPILGPVDLALRSDVSLEFQETLSVILQTHLVQDVLLNHLQGRNLNFRPDDATCIFNFKSYQDVMNRWKAESGAKNAVENLKAKGTRLLVKATGRFHAVQFLGASFPGLKILEIRRDLVRVAISIAERRWFSQNEQQENSVNSFFLTGDYIPYFLTADQKQNWQKISDESRAARTAAYLAELSLKEAKKISSDQIQTVSYESLIREPDDVLTAVFEFCGLEPTEMTHLKKRKVRTTEPKIAPKQFLSALDIESRDLLLSVNDKWSA